MNLTFQEASKHIKEGDILLFRGVGLVAKFIMVYGGGKYSHVGLASFSKNGRSIIECVEFREGKGGRTVNLEHQVELHDGLIDVYRPASHYEKITFINNRLKKKTIKFNGKAVTNCLRRLTGLPYGWKRIWEIFKMKMIVIRLFFVPKNLTDDNPSEFVYPVCSSVVASCFSSIGYDLVTNKNDQYIEPSQISNSPLIHYLFTIKNSVDNT